MATGLDIVATNVGGNSDLVDNGRCGNLVPSGVDALAVWTLVCAHLKHVLAGIAPPPAYRLLENNAGEIG